MIPTLQLGQMGLRRASASGGGGGATDAFWSSVVLLLNMGGADGSAVFTDAKGHTINPQGGMVIDTSLGFNAAEFDGVNDLLLVAGGAIADFGFGTGDLTSEFWVQQPSGQQSGDRSLSVCGEVGALSVGLQNGKLFAGPRNVAYGPMASTAIAADTLTHVAACRHSGTMYIYHGGVVKASAADSNNYGATASLSLGATTAPGALLRGWMAAARLTKGVARYPGGTTFTPPSLPLPTS